MELYVDGTVRIDQNKQHDVDEYIALKAGGVFVLGQDQV